MRHKEIFWKIQAPPDAAGRLWKDSLCESPRDELLPEAWAERRIPLSCRVLSNTNTIKRRVNGQRYPGLAAMGCALGESDTIQL